MRYWRNQVNVLVQATDTPILGPEPRRIAVVISGAPSAGPTIWLSLIGPAAVNVGLPLYPGNPPLVLYDEWLTDWITEGIRGVTSAGTVTIGIWDIMAAPCKCEL